MTTLTRLSIPMRDLLWQVAQMKHGWAYVSRFRGELQVADGLVRRGLVVFNEATDGQPWRYGRDGDMPQIVATDAGREEIARRWPVSPFILGTYDWRTVRQTHGEWTPREGVGWS